MLSVESTIFKITTRNGENFNKFLFRNSSLYIAVKNYENRSIFVWVIEKNKSVSFFMARSVDYVTAAGLLQSLISFHLSFNKIKGKTLLHKE